MRAIHASAGNHTGPRSQRGAEPSRPETMCPACGRPIVPDGIRLSPTQRKILDAVDRRGEVSPEDLRAIIWANDPNGGPEDPKALAAHVYWLNQKLAARGLVVRAGKGAGAVYRLRGRP